MSRKKWKTESKKEFAKKITKPLNSLLTFFLMLRIIHMLCAWRIRV